MRPLGYIGVVLIIAGIVVFAMGGVSYTKDKNQVDIGPLHVAAVEKGFIAPLYGMLPLVLGAGLLYAGTRRNS